MFGKRKISSNADQSNSSISAPCQPLGLTIGVEFEFIILRCAYPEKIGHFVAGCRDNPEYGADLVRGVLSQPLHARCDICHQDHIFSLPLNQDGNKFDKWTVDTDHSVALLDTEESYIHPQDQVYCREYAVEVKTRILHADKRLRTSRANGSSPHIHEITYQEEIRAVLESMASSFNLPASADHETRGTRLIVNKSCGLHVHVGNNAGRFPLSTVKNVLATHMACERAVDELHAADRISSSNLLLTPLEEVCNVMPPEPPYDAGFDSYLATEFQTFPVYNRSLRGIAMLNALKISLNTDEETWYHVNRYPLVYRPYCSELPEAATQFHCASFIKLITDAPSIAALQSLQSGSGHCITVNIENLESVTVLPEPTRTIEFRQHTGTIDATEVIHWIDVVTSMVRFAHQTHPAVVLQLCEDTFSQPTFRSDDLLVRIGAAPDTRFHYHRRAHDPTFVQEQINRDVARVESLAPNDPFKRLIQRVLRSRERNNNPNTVIQQIMDKLYEGGYGQIHEHELRLLPELYGFDFDEVVVQLLAVGGSGKECLRVKSI